MHDDRDWTGPAAAKHFTVWLILWIVIDFFVVTGLLTFA